MKSWQCKAITVNEEVRGGPGLTQVTEYKLGSLESPLVKSTPSGTCVPGL